MSNWYRLDSNAKVFPAVTSEINSAVFRGSVILTEAVNPDILQQAVDIVIKRFPVFAVKLGSGIFWNYLYENKRQLEVQQEQQYPCKVMDPRENNGFMLRVLYFNHRIGVEIFHGLSDGLGALEFLKTLVYQYLLLSGKDVKDEGLILLPETIPDPLEAEDSYQKYYHKLDIGKIEIEKPHTIKGTLFEPYGHHTTQVMVSASALIERTKAMGTSLTVLVTALLIKAIYLEESKHQEITHPIIIGIPVNLRRMFPSKTLRNFYAGTRIIADMTSNMNLEDIIKLVEGQLKGNLTKEHLQIMLNLASSIRFEQIPGLKFVPLFFKNRFIQHLYKRFGDATTINLSNLGRITLPTSMEPYIEKMEIISYPKETTPINCAMGSAYDQLNISFVRNIVEADIIERFCELLAGCTGLDLEIYSNNWGADTSGNHLYPKYEELSSHKKLKHKLRPNEFCKEWKAKIHI